MLPFSLQKPSIRSIWGAMLFSISIQPFNFAKSVQKYVEIAFSLFGVDTTMAERTERQQYEEFLKSFKLDETITIPEIYHIYRTGMQVKQNKHKWVIMFYDRGMPMIRITQTASQLICPGVQTFSTISPTAAQTESGVIIVNCLIDGIFDKVLAFAKEHPETKYLIWVLIPIDKKG